MQAYISNCLGVDCGCGGTQRLARRGFELGGAEQFEAGGSFPDGFGALHFDEGSSAGFGQRAFFDQGQDGRSVFDGQPEPVPIRDGDAVGGARGDLAEVEYDGAESAGVDEVIGDFERVGGVLGAADPDELGKGNAGRGGGDRIEGIAGIDVGADFRVGGGGGEQGVDESGAAGAFGSD